MPGKSTKATTSTSGTRRRATFKCCAIWAGKWDLRSTIIPRCACAGSGFRSHIRKLLSEGQVSRARHLLARPFSILATPGRGRGYGAKYTVPTINLARYEELVPKDGVYVTRTRLGSGNKNECFDSVTNVGNRPTFGSDSFAVESHLLNFLPLELSPETEVELYFLDRLRDEIKFP